MWNNLFKGYPIPDFGQCIDRKILHKNFTAIQSFPLVRVNGHRKKQE